MASRPWYPDPERDRRLAATPRYRARKAQPMAEMLDRWTRSAEYRRLKRFHRVQSALERCLGEERSARARPLQVRRQELLIEVDDAVLLSELRNCYQKPIIDALVEAGTGITRVRFRLRRGS